MADITLDKAHTALLVADFYAEQMGKLPHAVGRKCLEKTLALRQAARAAVSSSAIPRRCSGRAMSR